MSGLGFTRIARHRRVTQCLGSLGGKEWLIGVAPSGVTLVTARARASRTLRFPGTQDRYPAPLLADSPSALGQTRVGVTMAMIGVIVGEFITAQARLGCIIMFASSAGETATVLAAIVLLCVALGGMAVRRWYGGEMPVGGMI